MNIGDILLLQHLAAKPQMQTAMNMCTNRQCKNEHWRYSSTTALSSDRQGHRGKEREGGAQRGGEGGEGERQTVKGKDRERVRGKEMK